jgi:hypothetical protein
MEHDLQAQLTLAAHYVERGKRIIARQEEQIERLRVEGLSTETSEAILATFLITLGIFQDHERHLRGAAAARRSFAR